MVRKTKLHYSLSLMPVAFGIPVNILPVVILVSTTQQLPFISVVVCKTQSLFNSTLFRPSNSGLWVERAKVKEKVKISTPRSSLLSGIAFIYAFIYCFIYVMLCEWC